MHYESILDSHSNLSNIKNRLGLSICKGSTTSIYTAQSKLRKFLNEQLLSCIPSNWDRESLIDKIVDRCDDIDTINCIYEYHKCQGTQEFVILASGKIRPFFKNVYKYLA